MTEDHSPAGLQLPDVNVLVALTSSAHQHHRRAHAWLATVTTFATTPLTECGLVRLLLNPAVVGQRVTVRQAIDVLRGVRAHERATFLPDASSLAAGAVDLIGLVGHRQVTGFHLVNLVASQGGVLATFDRRILQSLAAADHGLVDVL